MIKIDTKCPIVETSERSNGLILSLNLEFLAPAQKQFHVKNEPSTFSVWCSTLQQNDFKGFFALPSVNRNYKNNN